MQRASGRAEERQRSPAEGGSPAGEDSRVVGAGSLEVGSRVAGVGSRVAEVGSRIAGVGSLAVEVGRLRPCRRLDRPSRSSASYAHAYYVDVSSQSSVIDRRDVMTLGR